MRKHTRKKLNDLVKFIRESNKPEPVCDSYMKCPEMQKMVVEKDLTRVPQWKYCPWCGKEIKR